MNFLKSTLSIIAVTAVLTACSTNYTVDISNMPEDQQEYHEMKLAEALDGFNGIEDEEEERQSEKAQFAADAAFNYMSLGKYSDAISLYEKVLVQSSDDFAALNNIASMYEEVGENLKALEYQQKLYELHSTKLEVVGDTIRLLVKNGKNDDALGVLQTFAVTEAGGENLGWVSDQFEYINGTNEKIK